jgi:predicted RNA-binding protein YlxR (DUF448 family)
MSSPDQPPVLVSDAAQPSVPTEPAVPASGTAPPAVPTSTSRPSAAPPSGPVRTCVGCRQRAAAADLVRVAWAADGGLVLDEARRRPGRGAWLHRRRGCAERAVARGGFNRAFRRPLPAGAAAAVAEAAIARPA